MALDDWAQRTLSRVTTPKEGEAADPQAVATITLTAESNVLESWSAPFPEPALWLNEARAVIDSYAEEWPKRRIPLMFTAQSASGEIKTQCPSSVQGKNAGADMANLVGGGNSAPKAFADAMTGLSQLQVSILKAAKDMIDTQQAIIKSKDEQIHQFAEYFRVKQEVEATEAKQSADASGYILDQVKQVFPLGMQAAELFIEERKQSNAAKATANAVAKAVTPSNGVTS